MKRTTKEEKRKLLEQAERSQALRNCGNNHHLTDEDGGFKSEYPHEDGNYSIGYLEDLCQWVTYHNNMTHEEKMESVLTFESIISGHLSEMGIHYVPTWSKILNEAKKDENPLGK